MEITLPEVWEHRLNTMAAARGQTPEALVEEALGTLYFMIVARGFPDGADPLHRNEVTSED
jgi:hypothetical protein